MNYKIIIVYLKKKKLADDNWLANYSYLMRTWGHF